MKSCDIFRTHLPIMPAKSAIAATAFLVTVLLSCAPAVYYVKPPDWRTTEKRDSTIQYYRQFIQGWKFFLDPGHGGEDRRNEGPGGEKEADINLRTALYLRDYLRAAGAIVFMSREKDTTVDLQDRSRLSNASGADIFISIHHNATGPSEDPYTNFTSVWYHAHPGDSSYQECNHDIAKYIQRDLAYVMGNPGSLSSFDGTLSDYLIYPNSGFSVLRNATIPAVLIEGSFFSSEYEERRLKIEEFNAIEAWGIFRGIGKYLQAGVPHIVLHSDTTFASCTPKIQLKIADAHGIDWTSIRITIDGKRTEIRLDTSSARSGLVTAIPKDDLLPGKHFISAEIRNINGNSSFPFVRTFTIAPPVSRILISAYPPVIPADGNSLAVIEARAFDRRGYPAVDGTVVKFNATAGRITSEAQIKRGVAWVYLTSEKIPENIGGEERVAEIRATPVPPDTVVGRARVVFSNRLHEIPKYVSGIIREAAPLGQGKPIEDVVVALSSRVSLPFRLPEAVLSRSDGRYIITSESSGELSLTFARDGFFGRRDRIKLSPGATLHDVQLKAIADSALFGKTFLIDPRYGGTERGDISVTNRGISAAEVNLAIAYFLEQLLRGAGADVHMVRSTDTTITEEERAKFSRPFRRGFYLRIDAALQTTSASCSIYPSIPNELMARDILKGLSAFTHLGNSGIMPKHDPFFYNVAIGTISIELPSPKTGYYDSLIYRANQLSWGIFLGILMNAGYTPPLNPLRGKLVTENGTPAAYVTALADFALPVVASAQGSVTLPIIPQPRNGEQVFFQTLEGEELRFEPSNH